MVCPTVLKNDHTVVGSEKNGWPNFFFPSGRPPRGHLSASGRGAASDAAPLPLTDKCPRSDPPLAERKKLDGVEVPSMTGPGRLKQRKQRGAVLFALFKPAHTSRRIFKIAGTESSFLSLKNIRSVVHEHYRPPPGENYTKTNDLKPSLHHSACYSG